MNDKFKRALRTALFVIMSAAALLTVADLSKRSEELRRLEGEHTLISSEVAMLQSTVDALQREIQQANSDHIIEQEAYENWRYTRTGEMLVVPIAVGEPRVTTEPEPTPEPERVTNQEVWLALFGFAP